MTGEPLPPEAEDDEIERRLVRGLRVAARRALALARRYRGEEGPRGDRERACVAQALAWRNAAHELRGKPLSELGPGLARTLPAGRSATRRTA
jgi:hypothetical protein